MLPTSDPIPSSLTTSVELSSGNKWILNILFGKCSTHARLQKLYHFTTVEGETLISKAYVLWRQNDKALITLITATLSQDALPYVIGSKTSREAWLNLKERFATISRSRIMQLKTNLQTIQKGQDSIVKFLRRIKEIRNQLVAVGVVMLDEDIVVIDLNGLPSEYNTIRTVIRARETPISMNEFIAQLLAEESAIEHTSRTSQFQFMTIMAAQFGTTSSQSNKGMQQYNGDPSNQGYQRFQNNHAYQGFQGNQFQGNVSGYGNRGRDVYGGGRCNNGERNSTGPGNRDLYAMTAQYQGYNQNLPSFSHYQNKFVPSHFYQGGYSNSQGIQNKFVPGQCSNLRKLYVVAPHSNQEVTVRSGGVLSQPTPTQIAQTQPTCALFFVSDNVHFMKPRCRNGISKQKSSITVVVPSFPADKVPASVLKWHHVLKSTDLSSLRKHMYTMYPFSVTPLFICCAKDLPSP